MILHGASAQNALIYKKVSTIAQNIMQTGAMREKKGWQIMFSAFRYGYFTYASSFGCWCYAYYFRPSGELC